jgi:hypothetical protein
VGHRALGRGAGAVARARPGALVAAEGCAASDEGTSAAPGGTSEARRQAGRRRRGTGEWRPRRGGGPGSDGRAPTGAATQGRAARWGDGREAGGRRWVGEESAAGAGGWEEAGRLEPTTEREKKLNLAL